MWFASIFPLLFLQSSQSFFLGYFNCFAAGNKYPSAQSDATFSLRFRYFFLKVSVGYKHLFWLYATYECFCRCIELRTLDIYGLKIYQSLKKQPWLGNYAHSVEKKRETTSCRLLKLIFVKRVTQTAS